MLVRQRQARPESASVCQLQPCIMRANGSGSMDIPVQSTHIKMNKELRGCSLLSCVCVCVCVCACVRACVHGDCVELVGISEVI